MLLGGDCVRFAFHFTYLCCLTNPRRYLSFSTLQSVYHGAQQIVGTHSVIVFPSVPSLKAARINPRLLLPKQCHWPWVCPLRSVMASREGTEDNALDGIEELKKSVFSTDTQPETSVCSFLWGHQTPNIQPKPIPCLLPALQLPSSHPHPILALTSPHNMFIP